MKTVNIKFPFSDANDNLFCLVVSISKDDVSAIRSAIESDGMIKVSPPNEADTYWYEGTLSGSVTQEDDNRDDVLSPFVSSKLSFNIVTNNFPSWLMDSCNYYTDVKVLLYCEDNKGNIMERWRGYLQCQALNMTVVDEFLICPLIAIDEVAVAKYIKCADVFNVLRTITLYRIIDDWSNFNSNNFSELYTKLGLVQSRMLHFALNRCIIDDNHVEQSDIINMVSVNMTKYKDSKADELFEDVLKFFGLKFAVGAYNNRLTCDSYLITDLKLTSQYTRITYDLENETQTTQQTSAFPTFLNPQKVDANFQITYEPDKYNYINVISQAQEPETHDYLDDENYEKIVPDSDHREYAMVRWGREQSESLSRSFRDVKYRKLYLLNPKWEEQSFITMENCQNISFMTNNQALRNYLEWKKGVYPLPESRPNGTDTDNIDFIQSKRGIVIAKLGEFMERSIDEDNKLSNYVMMCNNFWGSTTYNDSSVYEPIGSNPAVEQDFDYFKMATLMPFSNEEPNHPNDDGYLYIDWGLLLLNENISSDGALQRPVDPPELQQEDLNVQMQEINFPSTSTNYAFDDSGLMYNGLLRASKDYKPANKQYVWMKVKVSIGTKYWDGTQWVQLTSGMVAPFFDMPFCDDGGETSFDYRGTMYYGNKNYYYTELHPVMDSDEGFGGSIHTQKRGVYIPLAGLSSAQRIFGGQLKIEIWGPMVYQSMFGNKQQWNSILYLLMSGFDIRFTNTIDITGDTKEKKYSVGIDVESKTKEPFEVNLNLASAPCDGFFNNVMLVNKGSHISNLRQISIQDGYSYAPEQFLTFMYERLYRKPVAKVMFTKLWNGINDTAYCNADFVYNGLTEIAGNFQVLTRTFDYVNGKARFELMRVN